jgi:hypothetical protein
VQGQLRAEKISFVIDTECGHCQQPLQIEIDSQLNHKVVQPEAEPMVYVPMLDLEKLDEPSIIDSF